MSDDYEYDDEYNDYDNNSGSGLRKQLEKALKRAEAAEKKAADAQGRLAQREASEALTAKGYPAAVARLAIKDGVDIGNKEALDEWLTENGDLFAKPAAKTQAQEQEQEPDLEADEIPEGLESTYRGVGNIHAAASPAMVNRMTAALAAIPEDATKEQVREILTKQGL